MKFLYEPTFLGMLAAQYYLSYKTIHFLSENIEQNSSIDELLSLICQVEEYRLLPVRHNEDNINRYLPFCFEKFIFFKFNHSFCYINIIYFRDVVRELGIKTSFPYDSPCLKALLMIKCYLLDINLPNQEYVLDLKSVLDQIIRIIHVSNSLKLPYALPSLLGRFRTDSLFLDVRIYTLSEIMNFNLI